MATILKNNIKPGGSTLKGLVATDASGNKRDVKFVRQVNGSGTATTVYDTFKEYAYGDVTINSFSYGDIPANGTAITPSALTYSQVRTEVGHSGAKYGTATLTSGATVTYSGTGVNATTGAIGATKLSAADKVRTKITTVTVTVTLNGKSASKTFDVYQQANAITAYSDLTGTLSLSVGDIAASGGTKKTTDVTPTKSLSQTVTYTSGATRAGSISYGAVTGADVSANSLTSTEKARTAIKSNAFSITATGEGSKTKTAYATVYQAANAFVNYSYDAPTGLSISCGVVPAGGGSVTSGTVSGTCSQVRRYNYTAGNDQKRDTINPTYTGAWSGGASNIGSRGTTEDSANTSTGKTLTYTYTANSKSNTATCTVYQQRNVRTLSSIYLSPYQPDTAWITTVTNGNWNNVPASGGYLKTRGYANYTHTSGSPLNDQKITDDASLSWNTGFNSWITAHTNGGYYVANRTTTVGDARSATGTWTYGGKTATKSFTQTANAVTGTGNYNGKTQACYQSYTEYQVVNFASVGDIPAYGGSSYAQGTGQSRTNYKTSSYTKYEIHNVYTSGSHAHNGSYTTASGWTDGSAPAAGAWGNNTTVTGSKVSGSNLTTTVKARTKLGASSVTWNGKTASADIYQAANALGTQHYKNTSGTTGDNWAYGTPSNPTLTSKLAANGGSVTCSGSTVKNTKTYYLMYTSGSYSGLQTETPAGSVGYTISSNGNSRFAFASGSGTVINHSNMTTNATTDTLGVKAYNASDSSKQSAQVTASVTNSYSDAWNNPSVSAFGYATSSFAYSGGTSAAPNSKTASQSGTRTFTSGSTSAISNSTFTWTYSTSSTGFTVNSSTGVVTAAANAGAARSGVITATATANGKSGTKTFTFSQAKDPTNGYTFVDLNLPSGLKWAYLQINEPYQWGSSATYSSSSSQYYSGTTMDDAHDTARQKWGGEWRMPTKAEFQELINNTTNTFTINSYGTSCRLFTSKNNSKTVDLNALGYMHFRDGTVMYNTAAGMYWTRTSDSTVFAYALNFTKTSIDSAMSDGYNKKYGAYIKPVIVA